MQQNQRDDQIPPPHVQQTGSRLSLGQTTSFSTAAGGDPDSEMKNRIFSNFGKCHPEGGMATRGPEQARVSSSSATTHHYPNETVGHTTNNIAQLQYDPYEQNNLPHSQPRYEYQPQTERDRLPGYDGQHPNPHQAALPSYPSSLGPPEPLAAIYSYGQSNQHTHLASVNQSQAPTGGYRPIDERPDLPEADHQSYLYGTFSDNPQQLHPFAPNYPGVFNMDNRSSLGYRPTDPASANWIVPPQGEHMRFLRPSEGSGNYIRQGPPQPPLHPSTTPEVSASGGRGKPTPPNFRCKFYDLGCKNSFASDEQREAHYRTAREGANRWMEREANQEYFQQVFKALKGGAGARNNYWNSDERNTAMTKSHIELRYHRGDLPGQSAS